MFSQSNPLQPEASWLTVNRVCNLRCRWCYAEGTAYHNNEMSFRSAQDLTILSKKLGVQGMLLIGGEPTLWRYLLGYNHFCRKMGLKSVLVTNGIKFGDDEFWERYQQDPNDDVGLSLKAFSQEHLKEVAQSTAFQQMKKGIARACAKFNVPVSITYNSFYCGHIPEMVRVAIDCGANGVKIDFCSTTFSNDKPESTYMVSPQELAKNIMRDYSELVRITRDRLVFEMMIPFCLFSREFIEELKEKRQITSVCQLRKGKGLIWDENGNVLMCNALFDYPIGHYGTDFANVESLRQWLNSDKVLGYYNKMGAYPSVSCRTCKMYQDCGGGCPLRWAIYDPEQIVKPFD